MLKQLAMAAAVALVAAGGAIATGPGHDQDVVVHTFDFPAGTVCDFHYLQTFTEYENSVTFEDGREIVRMTFVVTHTNADTGYVLSEKGTLTIHIDESAGREVDAGVYWHLRDQDGKLVLVRAGRIVWDLETFEPISWTPNQEPSFSAALCPALGGEPA